MSLDGFVAVATISGTLIAVAAIGWQVRDNKKALQAQVFLTFTQ